MWLVVVYVTVSEEVILTTVTEYPVITPLCSGANGGLQESSALVEVIKDTTRAFGEADGTVLGLKNYI